MMQILTFEIDKDEDNEHLFIRIEPHEEYEFHYTSGGVKKQQRIYVDMHWLLGQEGVRLVEKAND